MVHGALSHRTHTPHDKKKALLTDILYNIIKIISSEIFAFNRYIFIFGVKIEKSALKTAYFFTNYGFLNIVISKEDEL